jgi:tRNA (adenine57-N1/adenine58-N1)-methyltransferase catalytic subunit
LVSKAFRDLESSRRRWEIDALGVSRYYLTVDSERVTEGGWKVGDPAALKRRGQPTLLIRLATGPQPIAGEGVLDLTDQIGKAPGARVTWLGEAYSLVRPTIGDLLSQLRRNAQIITPKDAFQLLYMAAVGPGARVAEAGAGSGGLTLVLAWAVGPHGRVFSYDRRADFLDVARQNITRAGFADRVEFRERDVGADGIDAQDIDAVLLDLPEPWTVLDSARTALRAGGSVGTYTPTYNQLERTVRALRSSGFDDVRSVELIERSLHVGEGGTRPEFDMLGHTGFLSAGRKVD